MNHSYFQRETSNGLCLVGIYDRLLQERKLIFTDEVNAASANELIAHLLALEMEDKAKPVTLYINSPGGEVASGLAVYDAIRELSAPVDCVCIGTAASMASIIFLAGRNRIMYEHTKIMIHDPLISGSVGTKKALELEKEAERLMETRKLLADIISERTGRTMKEVLEKTGEDCYMDAEEAMSFGIATGVVRNDKKEGGEVTL